jgi:chromosomal replication initiation ATPase DnaA
MTGAQQLALDLPLRPALGAEDFLVGPSNEAALALIDQWPAWPHWAVVILGEGKSGKSHLASVWRLRSNAEAVAAASIDETATAHLQATGTLLIENLEQGVANEALAFHLLNMAREQRGSILFTSQVAPGDLDIRLPDLRSRLRALPVATIEPPDDALLQAVLVKHFADRQLMVEPTVIRWLTLNIERSFEAAQAVVAAIDQRSLADRRPITRALAQTVVRTLQSMPQEGDEPPNSEVSPDGDARRDR